MSNRDRSRGAFTSIAGGVGTRTTATEGAAIFFALYFAAKKMPPRTGRPVRDPAG